MRVSESLTGVVFVVTSLALMPAARADRLGSEFMSCVGITGAAGRLACFDRVAATSADVPMADRPDFAPGKPLHVAPAPIGRDAATATVPSAVTVDLVSVAPNADGKSVFTLANGQIWEAEGDDPVFPDASGNTVTLTRSLLGLGYHLTMNHETRELTVRRVQ